MPPLQGAAILLPILICQDAISVWTYRRDWSAWNLKVLLPGSVLGIGAAWLFASYAVERRDRADRGRDRAALSCSTPGSAAGLRLASGGRAKAQRPHAAMGLLWGALAGFTSTLVQVGAPPFQIHVLPQRLDKLTLVGTTVMFFALMNLMKIVPYFAARPVLARAISRPRSLLLPLAIAANFLGIWLVRNTPTEAFLPDRLCADVR